MREHPEERAKDLKVIWKAMNPEKIISSEIWYEERKDFSRAAIGTDRIAHEERRGFELLQGSIGRSRH